MEPVIILHHHEITLKGENRTFFERRLVQNIRSLLRDYQPAPDIRGGFGRFIVGLDPALDPMKVADRLTRVFGIANVCPGLRIDPDFAAIRDASHRLMEGKIFRNLRVDTRRVDKRFPMRSIEVNRQLGDDLCTTYGVPANLRNPDITIAVEIVNGSAYVYTVKLAGAGGLPSGISGRVVSLLSAGIDSPVATWQIMKRGARVIPVHFHSMPYTSERSVDQVRQLAGILSIYQLQMKLVLIPFAEVQQDIVLKTPQPLRVILYRRMMMRIAEAVALKEDAEALVTGEAVGQVASQTLRNIRAIDGAVRLPILRPLSGADKEETMAQARRIGTYEISKEPFDDCCSFLAPRRPETWAKLDEVEKAETALNIPALIDAATAQITIEQYHFPDESRRTD